MTNEKNILFVTGSNSDYTSKEGKLLTDIADTVKAINAQNPLQRIVVWPDICSADKTPDLLEKVLFGRTRYNENREETHLEFDGVIGCGGKSLVLAYQAVRELRDTEGATGIPWTPTVFIPMKDTVTGGASAYWSIADVPSAAEPRPAVGLGNIHGALSSMYDMLFTEFTGVQVAYVRGAEAAAEKIAGFLRKFGLNESKLTVSEIDIGGGKPFSVPEKVPSDVQVLVYEPNNSDDFGTQGFFEDPAFTIVVGDKKQVFNNRLHFEVLDGFGRENPFISVGVGNYDAAAILAAHLLRDEGIEEKIQAYKMKNAQDNVLTPRAALHERFPEGIR